MSVTSRPLDTSTSRHLIKSGVVAAKRRLAIHITMGSKDYSVTALIKDILTKSKRGKEEKN